MCKSLTEAGTDDEDISEEQNGTGNRNNASQEDRSEGAKRRNQTEQETAVGKYMRRRAERQNDQNRLSCTGRNALVSHIGEGKKNHTSGGNHGAQPVMPGLQQ